MSLPNKIHTYIDAQKQALVQCVQESVRIPSVREAPLPGAPYGEKVAQALEHALQTAAGLGFETRQLDGQVGWCEYGEGDEMVAVLGHLDVVPAGDGWQCDPFCGEIAEGCLWGRGSMDDKGPLFAALYGLKALADSGAAMKRRVRIIFGTNEETGSADIPHYRATQELPVYAFTPDGEFPVIFAEKGILNVRVKAELTSGGTNHLLTMKGGEAPNVVPASCKAVVKCKNAEAMCHTLMGREPGAEICVDGDLLTITTTGKSAHGSVPHLGENAITKLALALHPSRYKGGAGDLIHFLARIIGRETDGKHLKIAMQDKMGALTVNVGTVCFDETHAEAVLNIRWPVTKTRGEVLSLLEKSVEEAGLKLEVLMAEDPLYCPCNAKLVTELMGVYEAYRPACKPLAIGGGTYAKTLPNTVAFGPLFPGREDRNHQANEFIGIEELMELCHIYADGIYKLANG